MKAVAKQLISEEVIFVHYSLQLELKRIKGGIMRVNLLNVLLAGVLAITLATTVEAQTEKEQTQMLYKQIEQLQQPRESLLFEFQQQPVPITSRVAARASCFPEGSFLPNSPGTPNWQATVGGTMVGGIKTPKINFVVWRVRCAAATDLLVRISPEGQSFFCDLDFVLEQGGMPFGVVMQETVGDLGFCDFLSVPKTFRLVSLLFDPEFEEEQAFTLLYESLQGEKFTLNIPAAGNSTQNIATYSFVTNTVRIPVLEIPGNGFYESEWDVLIKGNVLQLQLIKATKLSFNIAAAGNSTQNIATYSFVANTVRIPVLEVPGNGFYESEWDVLIKGNVLQLQLKNATKLP